jgi:hypothetical protein
MATSSMSVNGRHRPYPFVPVEFHDRPSVDGAAELGVREAFDGVRRLAARS